MASIPFTAVGAVPRSFTNGENVSVAALPPTFRTSQPPVRIASQDVAKGIPDRLSENSTSASLHLMSQIQFLHGEVERLESQLSSLKETNARDADRVTLQWKEVASEKDATIRALKEQIRQSATHKGKSEGGEDLLSRCRLLENQLATTLAAKNALSVEKHELMAKMRKLEQTSRDRKREVEQLLRQATEETAAQQAQIDTLQNIIESLSTERTELTTKMDSLREQVRQSSSELQLRAIDAERQVQNRSAIKETSVTIGVQTGNGHDGGFCSGIDVGCQVNMPLHTGSQESQSVQSVAHTFELKCMELDEARAAYDVMAERFRELQSELEFTRKRCTEESQRRLLVSADAEKLSLQVRALQQRASQQAAAERELQARITLLEEKRQQLQGEVIAIEQERNGWEDQIVRSRRDMDSLVSNQNFANQQIEALTTESEELRVEVQKLLQREAQCHYALKSKDVEIQDLLNAYRQAVKENETYASSYKTIEREAEGARASLAVKEERTLFLQDQLEQMHRRERQLALDMQTFEHDNAALNHKLTQTEAKSVQMEAQARDAIQCANAKDRVCDELQQSIASLSSQIVIKDNESMLLRHRCETLEHEYSLLQSAHQTESQRLRQLEDSNARLVVRSVLTKQQMDGAEERSTSTLKQEVAQLRTALEKTVASLEEANRKLAENQERRGEMERSLSANETALREAANTREKLQRRVTEQAASLSSVSK